MTGTVVGGSEEDWPEWPDDLQEIELRRDRQLIEMCRGISFKWYLPEWPSMSLADIIVSKIELVFPYKFINQGGQYNSIKLTRWTGDLRLHLSVNPFDAVVISTTTEATIIFDSQHRNKIERMRCLIVAAQIAHQISAELYTRGPSLRPLLEAEQIITMLLEKIYAGQENYEESALSQKIIDAAIAAYAPFVPYVAADELAKTP